ncbi:MAG TPA: FmdB family zinc ribbon protein [Capsulimonadaceae bacterium]|jgi:putative FmdB family regulatory protein
MPTYAYQCDDCGNAIEVIQKMSDEPLKVCESCSGPLTKKMFPVGIVFKGSGFYVNDYAKKEGGTKSPTAAAPSEGSTPTDTSTAAETKTEAKTETKTESAPKAEAKPAAAPAAA